jgi:hypothetical protein
MSLSFRIRPNNYVRSLQEMIGYAHGSPELVHLAHGFVDDQHIDPKYLEAFREIELTCVASHANRDARFWAIQRALERVCAQLPPGPHRQLFLEGPLSDEFRVQLQFLKGTTREGLGRRFANFLKAGAIPEALACGERFLSLFPTDAEMKAAHARLKAEHPHVAPAGPPRVSLLDTSS